MDLDQARAELKEATSSASGQQFNKFLDGLGLGMISSQLKDLDLGELMDTPPPGVDEAIAISKVGYRGASCSVASAQSNVKSCSADKALKCQRLLCACNLQHVLVLSYYSTGSFRVVTKSQDDEHAPL